MKICIFRYIRFASKSCGFEGRHVLRNRRKALKIKVFRWQSDKLTTNLRQLPTKKRRDMYEATACILQTVAFSLQKRYFYNLISLLAVEKNELKRVKNMI